MSTQRSFTVKPIFHIRKVIINIFTFQMSTQRSFTVKLIFQRCKAIINIFTFQMSTQRSFTVKLIFQRCKVIINIFTFQMSTQRSFTVLASKKNGYRRSSWPKRTKKNPPPLFEQISNNDFDKFIQVSNFS
jgi:hypothetical protein